MSATPWSHGPLTVSTNRRRLVHSNGTPFFYLADTAWELFHRLTLQEARLYLETRKRQGFNAIQCVLLAELDGLRDPNRNGDLPFINGNLESWNPPYWAHVDAVLDIIAELGLYAAILPTWGDKINRGWGEGPEIFNDRTMLQYASQVSARFRHRPNIIWVVGGDRNPDAKISVFHAEAEGLRKNDPFKRLMTVHPQGGSSSSEFFHDADWLDFNMQQTGHGERETDVLQLISADIKREPTKPVLDGEPRYENHPPFGDMQGMHMDDTDCRRAAYASVFAGACGVTYGCHAIWQFASNRNNLVNRPLGTWQESLGLPGAVQYGHLKALCDSLPFENLLPNPSLLKPTTDGSDWLSNLALATEPLDTIAIYTPFGRDLDLELEGDYTYQWFNPRNASRSNWRKLEGKIQAPRGTSSGNDYVVIVSKQRNH